MIYLDYAATSPVRPEVLARIQESLAHQFGNPSAVYSIGKQAKQALRQARNQLARALGVSAKDIYFTSGATEANNWAIRSQAYQARHLGLGDHLVCSAIEHPSVMEVCQQLEQEGFQVTYIKPDANGEIKVDAFQAASTDRTTGWICMAVNNEVGAQLPIHALGQAAQAAGYWLHVDTVQALGQEPWVQEGFQCTSFVGTGHKFYAPKGIGFLVYQPWNPEMTLTALIRGGGQEMALRSGTENLAYIEGLALAMELAVAEAGDKTQHFDQLTRYLFQRLDESQIAYQRNGDSQNQAPYIHSLWFEGIEASQILIQMDLAGICLSAGSACSAGSVVNSRILQAYYPDQADRWHQSIRLSFGRDSQTADIDAFIDQLKKLSERKMTTWHLQNKQA
ncbi:cysteine desulfurase family protein [Vaginisenegalia massiliensis]|uniref:cysteine desulfurase family protein n=1 Tax=Vaginisenegalia massiliensis TaxID=2058294 RepID=UPI000F534BA3|nr:cysteine desulfurase family protein [Vaginisenegalia massiliensis]